MEFIVSYLIPIGMAVIGLVTYYRGAVLKSYSARQDFSQIRKDMSEMNREMISLRDFVDRRIDHMERTLIEVKVYLSQINKP